eukprot:GFUD01063736.1.p1 GENE.GFUD01063736.1~~GFUD01063736.1.p1  ORF type:complete len:668 (+),score=70.01 GFUD01063736.1:50-2053(+)
MDCVCLTNKLANESETYYDPSYKGPNNKRSCTDVTCLLLLITFSLGWAGVAIYAFANGNPARLIHPSNSEGEICGKGNQTGKPNLLYFDLTWCAGLPAVVGGCPTTQICVEECPRTYWNSAQGKSSDLDPFCVPGTNMTTEMAQLVEERSCPAYILPSKSVLGRCVPTFGLVSIEETGRAEAKMNAIKKEDGKFLQAKSLREGVGYVMDSVDTSGPFERFLSYLPEYWWIILLSFILSLILSIIWSVLIKLKVKPAIWIIIVLSPSSFLAGTVLSILRYSQTREQNPIQKDTYSPPDINSLTSYWNNKSTWLLCGIVMGTITLTILILISCLFKQINVAIKLIKEASKAINSMKSVLIIPLGKFVARVLLIFWFMTIAIFLATSGLHEYRVVDTCSSETYINTATGKMFQVNDICDQNTFVEKTGCPRAQCVHHKFGHANLGTVMQVWNFFGMVWILMFIQSLGEMIMAGAFAEWYWKEGMRRCLSSAGVWSSLRRTCRYHLGTVALGSLVPWMCCRKNSFRCISRSSSFIITAVHGNSFCGGRKTCSNLLSRNGKKLCYTQRVTTFILFTGKLFIVGLVAAAFFATSSSQVNNSPVHIQQIYQIVPILTCILGSFAITSSLFSLYAMAVDTIYVCILEDLDKHDGSSRTPYCMNSDMVNILQLETS